jgi:type I restriction enzyme S subunit
MTNLSGANLNNRAAAGPQGKGMDRPSTFPKYSAYKDSGIEWAGALPAEWQVLKLKRAARLQSGEFITSEAIEDDAQYPVYGGNGLRGYTVDYTHDGEFALIGRQGALCGNINYAEGKFWASEHAVVVYPEKGIVTRWLGELLRSMNLGQYSVSAAQPGLSVERIADLLIPMPSQAEQTQIACFLDHETARIDALIEEQQRLIELLKEKRQAVVSHAVTQGLDPNVPMKYSGVEWIGEVPAHWDVKALRYLGECQNGINIGGEAFGSGSPFVSYGDVHKNQVLPAEVAGLVQSSPEDQRRYSVRYGDVLFTRTSETVDEIGFSSTCLQRIDNATFAGFLIRFRPIGESLSPNFSKYYFRNQVLRIFFNKEMNLVTRASLSQDLLKLLPVTVPPLSEQEKIAAFLDRITETLASLLEQGLRSIELLTERRSALISAAVTGKIDVRGWQSPVSVTPIELTLEAV